MAWQRLRFRVGLVRNGMERGMLSKGWVGRYFRYVRTIWMMSSAASSEDFELVGM
jgi:hypothetical protein